MNAIVEQLKSTAAATKATDLRAAFAADPQRFSRFSVSLDDLLMDYSKTAVNDEILALLVKLAETGGVEAKRDEMFSGKAINFVPMRQCWLTARMSCPTSTRSLPPWASSPTVSAPAS
jgi:glucose-6-phosphate isomerase